MRFWQVRFRALAYTAVQAEAAGAYLAAILLNGRP
jgi:hypothetical protein